MTITDGDNMTTYDGLLKQIYATPPEDLINQKNFFWTKIKKMAKGGNGWKVPLIIGPANGGACNIATAATNAIGSATTVPAFFVNNRGHYHQWIIFDTETMLASEGDGGFLPLAKLKMETEMMACANSMSDFMYGSGQGDLANVGSATQQGSLSSKTLTLSNPGDAKRFEVGYTLDVSATQTGALKSRGSSNNALKITGVDRTKGVLTFASNINDGTNGIPTITYGDYIFREGTHDTTGVNSPPVGIEAWLPVNKPVAGSDSFFGVDRSSDNRLYGISVDGTGAQSIENLCMTTAGLMAEQGCPKLDVILCSFRTYTRACQELTNRVFIPDQSKSAKISFEGVQVITAMGAIPLRPDRSCRDDRLYFLNLDTWYYYHLDKPIRTVGDDGLLLRPIPGSTVLDGWAARLASYGHLVCTAPGWNANVQITASP